MTRRRRRQGRAKIAEQRQSVTCRLSICTVSLGVRLRSDHGRPTNVCPFNGQEMSGSLTGILGGTAPGSAPLPAALGLARHTRM